MKDNLSQPFNVARKQQARKTTCASPVLPIPFIEEAIFTPLYAHAPVVKYKLTIETWVYFWALYYVPMIYVCVLNASTRLF